jgi:hypothetical protein
MSAILPKADIRFQRNICRDGPIVLQNDFWPWSKEQFFGIESQWGILIQKSGPSDSIIAHFSAQLARLRLLQHNRPQADIRVGLE